MTQLLFTNQSARNLSFESSATRTAQSSAIKFVSLQKDSHKSPEIDFDETFATAVKHTSIRIMCTLAVHLNLHFHHLDVDAAFLNGPLEEGIYLRIPEDSGELTGKVVRLPVWNELLDAELQKIGYIRIHANLTSLILVRTN
jgi:hypothetical protein